MEGDVGVAAMQVDSSLPPQPPPPPQPLVPAEGTVPLQAQVVAPPQMQPPAAPPQMQPPAEQIAPPQMQPPTAPPQMQPPAEQSAPPQMQPPAEQTAPPQMQPPAQQIAPPPPAEQTAPPQMQPPAQQVAPPQMQPPAQQIAPPQMQPPAAPPQMQVPAEQSVPPQMQPPAEPTAPDQMQVETAAPAQTEAPAGEAAPAQVTATSTGGETTATGGAAMEVDESGAPAAATATAAEAAPQAPVAAPPVPEVPKEPEADAVEDARPRLSGDVAFHTCDTTMNVIPSVHGNVLIPLIDGGLHHLLAGARGSVGVKSGRYLFEAKIVEVRCPQDFADQRNSRVPQVRPFVRLGFATAGSSLFLGSGEGTVCFDSEGSFTYKRRSTAVSKDFTRDQVLGVLLNLEEGSPCKNTISLFKDGVRICQPQPLPEALHGKPLFPALTFKGVTMQVNFGPKPAAKMPFSCRLLQDAAADDVVVAMDPTPADRCDVLFPVCLPDEGAFEWLDFFLEKCPHYTELSDRMLLDWGEKSGISKRRGHLNASNDKPDIHFGIPQLDAEEAGIRRILKAVAPLQRRNFVVMEVKSNLMKGDRTDILKRFSGQRFKKIAVVLMGAPAKELSDRGHAMMLQAKQERSDSEFKVRKAAEKQKKLLDKRQKELDRERRKIERAAKKAAAEEAAKKAAEEKKKAAEENGEQAATGDDEKKEGDGDVPLDKAGAEEKEEDEDEEMDAVPEKEDDEMPPVVELSEEERKSWFPKNPIPDLAPRVLSANFTSFTIPETAEGFDEVRYDWQDEIASAQHLKEWVLARKITTRVEDIQPSVWFREQWTSWQNQVHKWHQKQLDFKESAKKPTASPAIGVEKKPDAKAAGDKAAEKTEEAKKEEGAKEEGAKEEGAKEEGAKEEGAKEEGAKEEAKQVDAKKEEAPKGDGMEVDDDVEDLDVFAVTDICNVAGTGEPLFAKFALEDWALLGLRFELHLLGHAFRRDVADPERKGIHLDHLSFYYNRYFRKAFSLNTFGVDSPAALVELVGDTVDVGADQVLLTNVSDALDCFDVFIKLTEETRRDRQLRIDCGEDVPPLKFNVAQAQPVVGAVGVGAVAPNVVNPRPQYGYGNAHRSEPYHKGGNKSTPQPGKGGGYGPQTTRNTYGAGGYSNTKGGYMGGKEAGGFAPHQAGRGMYLVPQRQHYGQNRPFNAGYGGKMGKGR